MQCPKCSHERGPADTAPAWQCPACGVAYAKVAAGSAPRARSDDAAAGPRRFSRLVLVALALGAGVILSTSMRSSPGVAPLDAQSSMPSYQPARVVMYSLTTCGYCNRKRAELKANGIPFVEHFVDQDRARQRELFDKLQASGFRGGVVGTPTFEVNGTMLPNNPSLSTIRKHL